MSVITMPPAPGGTTTPPPPVTGWPRPLRWTVALFHAINSTGAFAGRRPRLIRGVLLEQGPMNPPHAVAQELLTEALRAAFGSGWRTRTQLPLVLGQDSDPLPDAAMVRGNARTAPVAHPTSAELVVEVSDMTLTYDMTDMAELYATTSIPEYWVLDVNGRQLHVYRNPQYNAALSVSAYQTHDNFGSSDSVSPLAASNSRIRVADLLP